MALHDWNHNGKKDVVDDFIEYQIYKETTKSNNVSGSSGGMSTFGAIVATIGGLFLAAGVVALFGGGENTPVALIVILWVLCSVGLGVWWGGMG